MPHLTTSPFRCVPFKKTASIKKPINLQTKNMRQILLAIFTFLTLSSFGQKLQWIPFDWVGDSISGKYFDKLLITIPVSVDNLPHKFNMQFDLGAINTMFYGNSIEPYLEKYSTLKSRLDTTLIFRAQSQTNYMFKDVSFKLGNVSFGKRNIGNFKNFGDEIPKDSIMTKSEKHIGTIAPDLFENKVLIIDYPNKRLCVVNEVPKQFQKAQFRPYKTKEGRIKIPITINGKDEDVMFDTGSSLFSLITTKDKATAISENKIVDSLKISSWGDFYMVYGQPINSKIKFGTKELSKATVFFDNNDRFASFYKEEEIWGITGNAYFLKNVVIIDYKNKLFGVK